MDRQALRGHLLVVAATVSGIAGMGMVFDGAMHGSLVGISRGTPFLLIGLWWAGRELSRSMIATGSRRGQATGSRRGQATGSRRGQATGSCRGQATGSCRGQAPDSRRGQAGRNRRSPGWGHETYARTPNKSR